MRTLELWNTLENFLYSVDHFADMCVFYFLYYESYVWNCIPNTASPYKSISNFMHLALGISYRIKLLHENSEMEIETRITAPPFADGVREMATSKQTRHRRREAKAYEKLRPTNPDWRNLESKSLVEICGTHRSNCGELQNNAPRMCHSKYGKSF